MRIRSAATSVSLFTGKVRKSSQLVLLVMVAFVAWIAACGPEDESTMQAPVQPPLPTGIAGAAGGGIAGTGVAGSTPPISTPTGIAGTGTMGFAGGPGGGAGRGPGRGVPPGGAAGGVATPPAGTAGMMAMPLPPGPGGSTPLPRGDGDVSKCPQPPADSPELAVKAWTEVNKIRLASGAGCMNLVPALNQSAAAHCSYMAMNKGNRMCTSDPHGEMMSCTGFTGANVQAREVAAGYPRNLAYTEVLTTFGNNPVQAVPNWIDTVWHRIPLLDPWTADMGYGGAAGCDVIDIGRGMTTMPANTVAVYPYDGQINVPPTFSGLEGPAPPPPPSGWPSAYPINVYAQKIAVTEHVITKDGDPTPLEHLWLDSKAPEVGSLRSYFGNTVFMYGAPFELNTKYRVKIVGTYAGGALNLEWTFTTGSRRPFGT